MVRCLNWMIARVKREPFVLSPDIPIGYILSFMFSKLICLCWGCIRLKKIGPYFVHPTSKIKASSNISMGRNFSVGRNCYIDALSEQGLVLGNNVSMGFHTHIELTGSMKLLGKGMIVGNNVGLGSHGHYGSGAGLLSIGDDTIFGNYVSIHPENHIYSDKSKPIRLQGVQSVGGVSIGNNCWIGAKATILDGTHIGNNCIVAAGAVVKGTFPDNVIIGGVPAKIIKYYRD